jgi:hypothetical protein
VCWKAAAANLVSWTRSEALVAAEEGQPVNEVCALLITRTDHFCDVTQRSREVNILYAVQSC